MVVREAGLLAFMRLVTLPCGGAEARARMLAHLAAEARPELSDIRLVRSLADVEGEPMPAVVPAFLRDAFAVKNAA
jgi:hypothetical protein